MPQSTSILDANTLSALPFHDFVELPSTNTLFKVDAGELDEAFASVSDAYCGYQIIALPPIWKERDDVRFTFVLFTRELRKNELLHFFDLCAQLDLPNPRPISNELLKLASLFHPQFYRSFTSGYGRPHETEALHKFRDQLQAYRLLTQPQSAIRIPTVRYYLQSLLFLAGCTLSAAIVQNRFSEATIHSKLNRLWQGTQYARRFGFDAFNSLKLEDFIVACDADTASSPYSRLIAIKRHYGYALRALINNPMGKRRVIQQETLSPVERLRFGFVDQLRHQLGSNLLSIIVYGSAVTSQSFSDYDLFLVVRNAEQAFEVLAGSSPMYNGTEINLSVYEPEDFLVFQAMSGDNLDHNARCVYGEAEILIKPSIDLILRNFSFAFVRTRQLLGMAGYLAKHKVHADLEEQANLYEYLVKIPMHIMKGVRSVAREPIDKEYLNAWTTSELGYDLTAQTLLVKSGRPSEAIANSYLATQAVITHLNERYQVFETVPRAEGDLWHHLEAIQPRNLVPLELIHL